LFNQDVNILENPSMRGQMTKIEELKEKAKVGWASFISFEALTSTAAPKLVKFSGVRQGMKLLDVACGTGVVALTASRQGVEVEGIDLTPELISRAIENSKIIEVYEFLDTELNAKTHDPANLNSEADDYGMMKF